MTEFKEVQWFNQWFMWLFYLLFAGMIVNFSYTWYVLEEAVDKVDSQDIMGQIIVLGLLFLSVAGILILRLQTRVDNEGIHYRFFPIHLQWHKISWYDVQSWEVREYHPLQEYGGWGIRMSFSSSAPSHRAYTVRGNKGLFLQLRSGKFMLLGTQKSKEIKSALTHYTKKKSDEY